jgi:hypothetical protein
MDIVGNNRRIKVDVVMHRIVQTVQKGEQCKPCKPCKPYLSLHSRKHPGQGHVNVYEVLHIE